jgi:hypothetical protein
MSQTDLDQLRLAYKKAIDDWVEAIRAEEALPTPEHSMVAMEHLRTSKSMTHTAKPPKPAKRTKTGFAE